MFALVPAGPLYEVYGWESDVAAMADLNPNLIYFWAEGDAEDFAPELTMEEFQSLIRTTAIAVNGPTAAANSGANPPSLAWCTPCDEPHSSCLVRDLNDRQEQSVAGVETDPLVIVAGRGVSGAVSIEA
jgi:hypothetical protein